MPISCWSSRSAAATTCTNNRVRVMERPVELVWAAVDSNHLPPRYQHGALPVELAAPDLLDDPLDARPTESTGSLDFTKAQERGWPDSEGAGQPWRDERPMPTS